MAFTYIDHTADVAVRLTAPDFEGLLEEASRALRDILLESESPAGAPSLRTVALRLQAEDREGLLVDFLNELIFRFDTQRLLPAGLGACRLEGKAPIELDTLVKMEPFDPQRHALQTEVKAATFHGLEIREMEGGLEVDVVFDL